jgi:hypothetical protein
VASWWLVRSYLAGYGSATRADTGLFARLRKPELEGAPGRTRPGHGMHEPSVIAVRNQGVHLPSVKVGCQRPRGQKRTEMMY